RAALELRVAAAALAAPSPPQPAALLHAVALPDAPAPLLLGAVAPPLLHAAFSLLRRAPVLAVLYTDAPPTRFAPASVPLPCGALPRLSAASAAGKPAAKRAVSSSACRTALLFAAPALVRAVC